MKSIARSLYRQIPEPLRSLRREIRDNIVSCYWLLSNACFDTLKYAKFSLSLKKSRSRSNEAALLTFYYHKIEKGLALPQPKPGFGSSWIAPDFLPLLKSYVDRFGPDKIVAVSLKALESYVAYHDTRREDSFGTVDAVRKFLAAAPPAQHCVGGGTIELDGRQLRSLWGINFHEFAASRHSIRIFSSEPVDREVIARAVATAQTAPSVCNRQAWHVYALADSVSIRKALEFQNGNAGFGQQIPCLLLVTCDTSAMIFTYERNQIWIDGGLFSMALIYALQSHGLATCCLNLSIPWTVERELGAFYRLKASERPIMMIAVGHPPDRFRVANSQRNPLSTVLTWGDKPAAK